MTGGRGLRALARGAVVLASLACAACATRHAFDRYVAQGLYEDAVRTFASDSTLWSRPDALLMVGRIYSDPSRPTFDPARARAAIERLVTAFPTSEESREVGPLLPLLAALESVRGELTSRTAQLDSLDTQADTMAASQLAAEREMQTLRRRIQRLEADLDAARRELERLKAIDLRRRPEPRR